MLPILHAARVSLYVVAASASFAAASWLNQSDPPPTVARDVLSLDRIPGAPAPSPTPVEVNCVATFLLDPLSCEETPDPPPRPTTHASSIWLEDGDPPPNVFPWPDSPRGAPPR